jgi:CBS domain-containing protein
MNAVERVSSLRVSEVLEKRPLFSEEDRASTAVGEILTKGVYEVFVAKGERVATATVRDLLSVRNLDSARLGKVSFTVPTVSPDGGLSEAAKLMFEYRLRAVPSVISEAGFEAVSAAGILRVIAAEGSVGVKASDVMTHQPVTLSPDDTALKARDLMLRRSFDHLPVVEDGEVVGIVTSQGLLSRLPPPESVPAMSRGVEKEARLDFPVSRVAENPILAVQPGEDIASVASRMIAERKTYSLVVLWDELQGIVTMRDIVSVLKPREKAGLPFYIVGLPADPFEAESAKMKFERAMSSLYRAFPFIQEARAVVKAREAGQDRRRYEVSVNIYTPRDRYAYSESGFDLPDIFDAMLPKLKRLLSSRQSRVTGSRGSSMRKGE